MSRVWHALVKLRYKVYNSSYIIKSMIKKIMYKMNGKNALKKNNMMNEMTLKWIRKY